MGWFWFLLLKISTWIYTIVCCSHLPQYVRNKLNPTDSKTRATAPTATVSRGRFSVKIWAMNWIVLVNHSLHKSQQIFGKRTEGAELAMKIKAPRYAAPLYERVPVALIKAPTPYAWIALPAREVPYAAAAEAVSRDLTNSSLEFAAWARW
jgi:hypothetical protein